MYFTPTYLVIMSACWSSNITGFYTDIISVINSLQYSYPDRWKIYPGWHGHYANALKADLYLPDGSLDKQITIARSAKDVDSFNNLNQTRVKWPYDKDPNVHPKRKRCPHCDVPI